MVKQVSYIALVVDPDYTVRFSTHPVMHTIGIGLVKFIVWHPEPSVSPDVRYVRIVQSIAKAPQNA